MADAPPIDDADEPAPAEPATRRLVAPAAPVERAPADSAIPAAVRAGDPVGSRLRIDTPASSVAAVPQDLPELVSIVLPPPPLTLLAPEDTTTRAPVMVP